ncbi:uncharacterized protein LOC132104703 [Carassius carassius]|uniref:uncharacterized protein LOC132104703 n=1 Tax=Carassius carassius TaxID=217509 RepID=UPI00286877CA|nr:uncharacterized protein LOC132104703 [Carassius carassius]
MLLLQDRMRRTCLSWCLFLLFVWYPAGSIMTDHELEGSDQDWGSGLHGLLNSFPADSPFVRETPGKPANCTQRFWLPPSSPVCWDDIAGPEEFEKSRLLVLQNRAALQAVSTSSGLEDGGASFDQQARENMQGVQADHLAVAQTANTMQKVFMDLDEKRKKGEKHYTFSSLKEQTENTKDSIAKKEQVAALLEKHLTNLERSLNTMQLRLAKLLPQ